MSYEIKFYALQMSNGLFASKSAAFVAALALCAAGIFCWRLFLMRAEFPSFRCRVFSLLALLFGSLAGNRISVVLFYRGFTDAGDIWPTMFSVGMGVALLGLSHAYTKEYCGNRGWVFAAALGIVSMFLG